MIGTQNNANMRPSGVTRAFMAAVVAIVVAFAAAESHAGEGVRLRRSATVTSGEIHLRDVAELEGEQAEAFGGIVVGDLKADAEATVTLESIRRALSRQDVNWARFELGGFDRCVVTRKDPSEPAPSASASKTESRGVDGVTVARSAPILANPTDEVGLAAQRTVREHLAEWVATIAQADSSDLHLTFADRDEATLSAPAGQDRFVFTAGSTTALGRLPVTIERMRGQQLIDTRRVTIHVSRRMLAVVATQDLRRGDVIEPADVEVREVKIDREGGDPISKIDDAVGQQANSSVRAGQIITRSDVAAPILVHRNELMRVQAVSGGLVVQMFARALEDGGMDQFVRARNERSREEFVVRVVGSRHGVLLTDAPDDVAVLRKATARAGESKSSNRE